MHPSRDGESRCEKSTRSFAGSLGPRPDSYLCPIVLFRILRLAVDTDLSLTGDGNKQLSSVQSPNLKQL
jgi:hypothetical protein